MNLKLKGNALSGNIEHWHGQNISPAIIIPIYEFQYFYLFVFVKNVLMKLYTPIIEL